jgi:hypothetical protein
MFVGEQYYLGLARQWKTKAVENWHSYFFIKEVFTNKMNRTQPFFKTHRLDVCLFPGWMSLY